VRVRAMQKRQRNALAWYLAGFLGVQLGLGVCIDRYWPAQRDSDFNELVQIVRERQAAPSPLSPASEPNEAFSAARAGARGRGQGAPGRPLVLVFGSSRTQGDLRAERLNAPADSTAPIVVNCAVLGGGPMMHQVMLRRFLDAGIRPDLAFVEVMPMALSARQGYPIEEMQQTWRYTAAEVRGLWRYYADPARLCYHWAVTRVFPFFHYQAQLRDVLCIDIPVAGRPRFASGRDDYGWVRPVEMTPPQEIERLTRENLKFYDSALTQPAVAQGALNALGDMLDLCLREHIPVVLILPPEGSAFRSYAPTVAERLVDAVRTLAGERGVPVIDARAWVDDNGFYDGHHALVKGADQYTQRFAREALAPYLARLSSRFATGLARMGR
jgi:hypothetical protein